MLIRSELASWQLYFPQLPSFKHVRHFPKNPWTLQWKGLNLHSRGPGPQISHVWGVRILRVDGILIFWPFFTLDPDTWRLESPQFWGTRYWAFHEWELSWRWLNRQKAVICEASLVVFFGCCQHCLKRYNVGWCGGPTANPIVPRFNEELLGRRLWSPIFESPNDSSKKIRSNKRQSFNQTIPKNKKDGEFPKEKPNHIAQYFARA